MLYLLIEPQFEAYPWCQRAMRGIYEEGRKKHVEIRTLQRLEQVAAGEGCVLLAGASESWIDASIHAAQLLGLYPVVLSNRQNGAGTLPVSSVSMDIQSSMELAVDYLHGLGKNRLALFGVNPSASSDPWRAERFWELTGSSEDIYELQVNIEETFQRFYSAVEHYDAVICANDYAAVSLIRRLQERNYDVPGKLYIVGYGDMFLSRLFKPSVTSVSDDYENFGRAALSICALVEKNETISTVDIRLKSRLHIRQTTENRPMQRKTSFPTKSSSGENRFYDDPELKDLALLENLFQQCDETDFAMVQMLLQGISYEEIAKQCYISETAVKYRIRKMKRLVGAGSREELTGYLKRFL